MTQAIIVDKIEKMEAEIERLSSLEFMQRQSPQVAWARAVSAYSHLATLISHWPLYMTNHATAYESVDMVGNFDLTHSASSPQIAILNNADNLYAMPCSWFSTDKYYSRLTDSHFNITGTEGHIAAADRGLTMGVWYRPYSSIVHSGLMGKADYTGLTIQYLLYQTSGGYPTFAVSGDGATPAAQSAPLCTVNQWSLLIGRYKPSTYVKLFHNGAEEVNTTSIPASLYTGATSFEVGRYLGTGSTYRYASGYMAHAFLCSGLLSDDLVDYIWQSTRGLYGV